jgi:hypothetical protein
MHCTVPDAPKRVFAIPEYSGETRLLKRIELSFSEPVSLKFLNSYNNIMSLCMITYNSNQLQSAYRSHFSLLIRLMGQQYSTP